MKKLLYTGLLLLIAHVEFLKGQDIRNSNWGDSMENVKTAEGVKEWKDVSTNGITVIYFDDKVGQLKASIAFMFIEDKLYRVKYIFNEEHSDESSFVTDFFNVKGILDDKYGKQKVETIWSNDLYRGDVDKAGFAVSIGHLMMITRWATEKMSIIHALTGDNYEITHALEYASVEFKYLGENLKKKMNSKDF